METSFEWMKRVEKSRVRLIFAQPRKHFLDFSQCSSGNSYSLGQINLTVT
jgi:hypothetical protein